MTRYKVRLSTAARLDTIGIISYLYGLSGEITAQKYIALFNNAFKKLSSIGSSSAIIGEFGEQKLKIRRVKVKRYTVYYTVNDEQRNILIVRVAHGSRDRNKLF